MVFEACTPCASKSLECARAPMGDGSCEVSASKVEVEEDDEV